MAVITITTVLKGTAKVQTQLKGITKSFDSMATRARALGKTLTTRLSLPLLAIGVASVKMAADFEKSMSQIVGLVGISRDQVQAWQKDIIALSGETAKAPKELAEALFFITSAGLRGQKALDALTASAKASAAGLGDMVAVADAVTSVMNAYAKSNLSAEKATGILVATIREGKLEAASLAGVLGNVIPIASALGVSFDQVGAAIAAMSKLGLNASKAVTSLSAVFSALLKPTSDAEKALRELSKKNFGVELSFSNLRKILSGPKGLIRVLQILRKATAGDVAAMGRLIPNVEALKGVLGLVGDSAEDTRKIFAALARETGDSLTKAFKEASETGAFKLAQTMRALNNIALVFGGIILPMIVEPAVKLTEIFVSLRESLSGLAKPIKTAIVLIFGLAIAIGPLALLIGFVGPAVVKGFAFMAKGIRLAVVVIVGALPFLARAFVAAFATIAATIAAISLPVALATVAIVASLIILAGATIIVINSWNTLAMAARQIWTQIQIIIFESVFQILDFILEQFGFVLPAAVIKGVEAALSSTAQFLAELRKRVTLEFNTISDIVTFTIEKVTRETEALARSVGSSIKNFVIEPFELMPKAANSAVNESNQAFDRMIEKLANVTSGATGTASAVESIGVAARNASRAVNAIGRVGGGGGGGAARPASGGPLPSAFNRGPRRRFRIRLPVPIPFNPLSTDEDDAIAFQTGGSRVFTTPRLIEVAEHGAERITAEPLAGGRGGRGQTLIQNFNGLVLLDEIGVQKLGSEIARINAREARRTV